MSLQTALTTRRQFLERSLWGFGSAFVLPSLLQSCSLQDHNIPPGIIPPIITDEDDIDWNDEARIIVVGALELIPEAGEILGPLADLFWPKTQEDVWGEIKDQVEALVKQEINKDTYDKVSGNLAGLNGVTVNYRNAINDFNKVEKTDPTKDYGVDVRANWIDLRNDFSLYLPNFKQPGDEVLLLPLFGQFVNMYLAVLRDAVTHGKSWGMSDGEVLQAAQDLTAYIKDFTDYTTKTYNDGRADLVKNTKPDNHHCEPFKTVNTFDRQMTLTVLDFMWTWPYYDVTVYPNGAQVTLTREIYTDPFGTCDDSGNIVIPTAPTQRPTNLTVWGYDRIDGIQLTYPANSGPGGVTQTKRMGNQNGGTDQQPYGGVFNLSTNNPFIQARATYGSIVNSLQFMYNTGGVVTNNLGGRAGLGGSDSGLIGYIYEALSSVWINGVSNAYGSADCVVFGFQYWNPPAETLNSLRLIYVKSPKEHTVADLAKKISRISIPAGLITDDLKAARKAYWDYIKSKATK